MEEDSAKLKKGREVPKISLNLIQATRGTILYWNDSMLRTSGLNLGEDCGKSGNASNHKLLSAEIFHCSLFSETSRLKMYIVLIDFSFERKAK